MARVSLAILVALSMACASDPYVETPQGVFVPTQAVLVDLSHTLDPAMPVYDGAKFAAVVPSAEEPGRWREFACSPLSGTHIKAPSYVIAGQLSVDRLNAGSLIGPVVLIDVTKDVLTDPDHRVSSREIKKWAERNGDLPPGAIVIMRSGWSARWGKTDQDGRDLYLNPDAQGVQHFPGFDAETVKVLARARISAIGVDTASVEGGGAPGNTEVQKILMAGGHYAIENLTGLDRIPDHGATIIVSPLKLGSADAAPARVTVLIPRT
jgi:kynurenine formamidase